MIPLCPKKFLHAFVLALFVCASLSAQPIDPAATAETKALAEQLNTLRQEHLLFGHQHTTEYGIGWKAVDTEDSDVKRTTGAFPAVYGWDLYSLQQNASDRGPLSLRSHLLAAHARGGINTITWHANNPVTGNSFYDTTEAVPALLPGGAQHAKLCEDLDAFAAFLNDLRDASGTLVPVIFRPWHEHNGDWFWWGTPKHCTPDQFATLWRFTVNYLRVEKRVHNLLYAWSPNLSWRDDYFIGYPGDDYVDVFGFDIYTPSLVPYVAYIRKLVERAEAHGKIPALTEAGYPDGLTKCPQPDHFTKHLLAPLRDDPVAKRVAWILLWRNADETHFWVPPPGHPLAEDFRAFYRDPFTLFGDAFAPKAAPAMP